MYVAITFAICMHIHTYVLRLTLYFSTFLPVSILAPDFLCMAESNEHHVTFSTSDQTQRYELPANPRKNTDNYKGATTLRHETFVFDNEYVDTRIWTTGSAYRSMLYMYLYTSNRRLETLHGSVRVSLRYRPDQSLLGPRTSRRQLYDFSHTVMSDFITRYTCMYRLYTFTCNAAG